MMTPWGLLPIRERVFFLLNKIVEYIQTVLKSSHMKKKNLLICNGQDTNMFVSFDASNWQICSSTSAQLSVSAIQNVFYENQITDIYR